MFKVGDKVKCVFKSAHQLEIGKIYTIESSRVTHIELVYLKEVDSIIPFSARSFERC